MEGKVLIFSAPSGSGKTTIVQELLKTFSQLEFSISATNRPPRVNEINGKDYYFVSTEIFKNRINKKAFVEFEEVYPGRYYGTLKSEMDRIWENKHFVVFDVDVKGGVSLKKIFGKNALSVFVCPPHLDALKERLEKRGTETLETLKMRLDKAAEELEFKKDFDVVLVNDNLTEAVAEAKRLVKEFLEKK
ncbi:MAG: guanylate kinase [Bacteroidetes bacterium HGW-Bacteroidetes-21]|nr:MAG: guanylate kinase [Bacteroidetes bacterium HGW-Bacteroidetes-21]